MKSEYKVTSYHPETTEEEKEEIYEQIAKVFIRMAQKDLKRNENKQKRWKQMKRKEKVYAFIGRTVVYSSLYMAAIVGTVWAFCQNTIY